MKQEILRKLMLIVVLLTSVNAFSYDFEVEGYYYNIISDDDSTVEITNDGEGGVYSGEVVIPNTVVYNDKIYTTVAIGEYAFVGCSELSSITIPNTIVEIKIGFHARHRVNFFRHQQFYIGSHTGGCSKSTQAAEQRFEQIFLKFHTDHLPIIIIA